MSRSRPGTAQEGRARPTWAEELRGEEPEAEEGAAGEEERCAGCCADEAEAEERAQATTVSRLVDGVGGGREACVPCVG